MKKIVLWLVVTGLLGGLAVNGVHSFFLHGRFGAKAAANVSMESNVENQVEMKGNVGLSGEVEAEGKLKLENKE